MITAETLQTLTSFTAPALSRAIQDAGYEEDKFTSAKFLGITNGGQFCYFCVFHVEDGTDSTKVYLTYNHANGTVSAEY
jgi:hypothetical protein